MIETATLNGHAPATDKRRAEPSRNGTHHSESRPMATPAELKAFQADFAICKENIKTAMNYLSFADQVAEAKDGMRRTGEAALECGQALNRMKDSKAFLDSFKNWAALCRGLSMSRSNSYRLMALVDAPPPPVVADPDPDTETDPDADNDGDDPDPDDPDQDDADTDTDDAGEEVPYSKLRETLASMSGKLDDEVAAPPKPRDAKWVEKTTVTLAKWFDGHAAADAARPHLEALVELAKRTGRV